MQNMISSMPCMARRASSMELFLRGSRSAGRISAGHGEGADPDFATGHILGHLQLPGRLCEVRGDQATHEFFSAVGLQAGGGAGPWTQEAGEGEARGGGWAPFPRLTFFTAS